MHDKNVNKIRIKLSVIKIYIIFQPFYRPLRRVDFRRFLVHKYRAIFPPASSCSLLAYRCILFFFCASTVGNWPCLFYPLFENFNLLVIFLLTVGGVFYFFVLYTILSFRVYGKSLIPSD